MTDTTAEKESLKKSKSVVIGLMATIILIFITERLITNPALKPLSTIWALLILGVNIFSSRKNKAEKASKSLKGAA